MRSKRGAGWRVFAALAAASVLHAQEPPAFDPTAPVLGGPHVVKLDWNIRGLVPVDLDGDGRTDVALINNDRSRIELLYQHSPGTEAKAAPRRVVTNRWEPELEDAPFEKRPFTAGITAYDLAAGDLNSDGRPDLVYTGDPDVFTVRYQSETGEWDEKRVFDLGRPLQYLSTLKIVDVNSDGRLDVVVLLQKEIVVMRQDAKGALEVPDRYAVADESSFSLELSDLNGDGRPDLHYIASSRREGLRVRLQQSDGSFGPELPYRIETARSTFQIIPRAGDRSPAFAYVQSQSGMLGVVALETGGEPDAIAALKPRVYSTRAGSKTPPAYAFGDVDGDGRTDLAVSDSDGAQIYVHFQNSAGDLGEGRPFPSLADGRSIAAADWDDDGRVELFVVSAKEQTLGVSTYTKAGRLAYPQPLTVTGKPVSVEAGHLVKGGPATVVVAMEEGGKRRIDFLERGEGSGRVVTSVELAGLRTDPRVIRLLDINQDDRLDVAVFIPFEAMRFLVQGEDGKFTDISTAPGYRKGLVENLDPSALTQADVDGDGRAEVIVSGGGFARVLRLDAAGMLQVADQFNAREPGADIAVAFAADVDGDGSREVILYDRKGEQLQVLRRNAQNVFIYADSVPVMRIDVVGAMQFDLNTDGHEDLFFLGRDRFWMVPIGVSDFHVDSLLTYETDLKGVRYEDVTVGDLNGDGEGDFVMVDPRGNLVEVLVRDGFTARSALHFRVFESDPHAQRRGGQSAEPRETVIADVTGDGKNDLLLLVHDRILIYPGE